MKRLQNRVAESRTLLPVAALYAVVVWLLAGMVQHGWWGQFVCFVLTTYLMVELNNTHALLRIYSRMVSSAYVVLMCAGCFLFASLAEAVMQVAVVAALLILFHSYQDKQASGFIYYGCVFLGVATVACVQLLWLTPLLWPFMYFNLQTLSWRTFGASLLGILTPYWFGTCWLAMQGDFTPLADHFAGLTAVYCDWFALYLLTGPQVALLVFVVVLMLVGTVHFLRQNFRESIRIRLLFNLFMWTAWLLTGVLLVQPCHYGLLMHVIIVVTAPLIAHFLALTQTRVTNAASIVITATALLLAVYSLWMQ